MYVCVCIYICIYALYTDEMIKCKTDSPGLPLQITFVQGYKICWHDWEPQTIVQQVQNS